MRQVTLREPLLHVGRKRKQLVRLVGAERRRHRTLSFGSRRTTYGITFSAAQAPSGRNAGRRMIERDQHAAAVDWDIAVSGDPGETIALPRTAASLLLRHMTAWIEAADAVIAEAAANGHCHAGLAADRAAAADLIRTLAVALSGSDPSDPHVACKPADPGAGV